MEAQPYSLLDDNDPFGYAKRHRMAALSPTVPPAALNPSGASQGFSPDNDSSDDSAWWKPQLDPAANRISSLPGLSSSGPAGTGQSAQPQADLNTGDVSAGAGKVLNGAAKKMPPPGMPAASDDPGAAGLPAMQAQPAKQSPPGVSPQVQQIEQRMADRAANPPKQIGERPQDFDPDTGKEKLGAKAASWGQRLALALLSATKLAPYAQQIVRPQWSEQVAANQIGEKTDEAQLKGLESAQNINYLGDLREATAAQKNAQAADYQTKAEEKQRSDQAREQLKADEDFTKSLGKDDVITGLDANDPNIQQMQQQGYHVIDDLRDHRDGVPKMKVAIPPRFVTVSPENQQILTGRQIGSLVPWSEYKSRQIEYQKQQDALELEKLKLPGQLKTEVKQLQIGGKPHQVLVNSQTGETIKDLGESGEHPPSQISNFNLSPEAKDMLANTALAGGAVPSFGSRGGQVVADIYNQAAKNKPGADLAGSRQDYSANTGVLKDLERNSARVSTSESTAAKNLDLAASVSGRVDRTGSPLVNKYLLYLKGQVAGDDDTNLLNNAVETAANEYANVVTAGSGGGAAATDSSRQHARDMLHSAMADGTFKQVVAQMKTEMGNRSSSFTDALKNARSGRPGASSQTGSGQIIVTAPDGSKHSFDTQALADAFKKLAGVK